jgi:hypothetical protein
MFPDEGRPDPLGYLYRYEDSATRHFDPFEEEFTGPLHVSINCYSYDIVKETPKGVRILYCGSVRTVLDGSRKKFACRTRQQALESFIARKNVQIAILEQSLLRTQTARDLARKALEEVQNGG